jgi:hypothetical protein
MKQTACKNRRALVLARRQAACYRPLDGLAGTGKREQPPLKTGLRFASAAKKTGAPAFGTGRCVAIDQLLNGLAESEVRTETL